MCCHCARDLARVAVIGPNAKSVRNMFGGYSAVQFLEMIASGDMGLPAPVQGGEVADDVMAPVAAPQRRRLNPDRPRNTGDDYGFVRRVALRPSAVGSGCG